jgi:hypothetical protein
MESSKPVAAQSPCDRGVWDQVSMWRLSGNVLQIFENGKDMSCKLEESPQISETLYTAGKFHLVPCWPKETEKKQ